MFNFSNFRKWITFISIWYAFSMSLLLTWSIIMSILFCNAGKSILNGWYHLTSHILYSYFNNIIYSQYHLGFEVLTYFLDHFAFYIWGTFLKSQVFQDLASYLIWIWVLQLCFFFFLSLYVGQVTRSLINLITSIMTCFVISVRVLISMSSVSDSYWLLCPLLYVSVFLERTDLG